MRSDVLTLSDGDLPPGLVGGKAASLSKLGRRSPPGVVLTRDVFDNLLSSAGLELPIRERMGAVDPLDFRAVEECSAAIQAEISGLRLSRALNEALLTRCREALGDGPYIVRSSAVGEDGDHASFAGQLRSILDVASPDLERATLECWASRYAPGVIAYDRLARSALGGVAVLVQPMLRAAFGGVLFTQCPSREDLIRIEYCDGHPEPLVQGKVSPEVVRLRRHDLSLHDRSDPQGPGLAVFVALAREALELAAERQAEIDVEWIVDEAGTTQLVQVRPITVAPADERGPIRVFSNANMNENYPVPVSPLLYSIARASYAAYFRGLGRSFGVDESRISAAEPSLRRIVGVHRGHLYYDLTAVHSTLSHAPFGKLLCSYFDRFVGTKSPTGQGAVARVTVAEIGAMAIQATSSFARLETDLTAFEASVTEYARRWSDEALTRASVHELLRDGLGDFRAIRLERWAPAALADAATSIGHGLLNDLLAPSGQSADAVSLLEGLEDLASLEPVDDLWKLSRRARAGEDIERERDAYVQRWGFRCGRELMLTQPRLSEQPELFDGMLAQFVAIDGPSPTELRAQACARREQMTATITRGLSLRRAAVLPVVLRVTHAAIRRRERARLKQAQLYGTFRQVVLMLGERLVDRGHLPDRDAIFWLEFDEIERLASGGEMFPALASAVVALRRDARGSQLGGPPPSRVELRSGEYFEATTIADSPSGLLAGVGAARGRATGTARCIETLADASRLQPGDILVTGQTDPGWGPLFFVAGGIVMERGGLLSHGAIVAREFGIPAVLGVAGALARIPDGAEVTVDGGSGRVEVEK